MNYSLHTNYQTSFRIVRKDGQTHFDAIRAIYDWLCTKEKDASLKKGWKEFSHKGDWDRCARTNARIQTATCIGEGHMHAWAMEYTHADRELGAQRFWHTHVGICETKESLIVSARVAYSWNTESLHVEEIAPKPSVPYFIRLLLKQFTTFSGHKAFRLIEKPLTLSQAGGGKIVGDFIRNTERRYPLIVFNGDSTMHKREAQRLATELAGKAQVVVVASNPGLGAELKQSLPADLNVGYQRMRVYFPMVPNAANPKRHRWFDVSSPDYAAQREGIVHGLLRNHNLVEKGAVESLSDVHRLIAKSRLEKLQQSTDGASEEEVHALYQDYIKELENERDQTKDEAEQWAQQVDQLESALREAEWKNKAMDQAKGGSATADEFRKWFFKLPTSLPEVVKLAAQLHADRLEFAEEAFDSAEESIQCELVEDAWQILSHIATTLYDLKFNADQVGDIGKKFQDSSGYEYARTEGKQTKNDAKLSRQRQITHNGKEFSIWPHIKKGNEGNKMIRIHFDFDTEEKKIVIGYVGLHMDNASTRGRK